MLVRALCVAVALGVASCASEAGPLQPQPVRPATDSDPEEPLDEAAGATVPPEFVGATPIPDSRSVAFVAADETQIVGRLFRRDATRRDGIVLAHGSASDMRVWFPFAQTLARDGYAVLAFDFRGYGQSKGSRRPESYPDDVEGAVDVLYATGSDRVAVIGTEVGGTAGVVGAARWPGVVTAVAAIGSAARSGSLDARGAARELDARALVVGVKEDGSEELARLIEGATTRKLDGAISGLSSDGELWNILRGFLREAIP